MMVDDPPPYEPAEVAGLRSEPVKPPPPQPQVAVAVPESENSGSSTVVGLDDDCPVCLSLLSSPVALPECGHVFCRSCAFKSLHIGSTACCPMCRTPTTLPTNPAVLQLQPALVAALAERYPAEVLEQRAHADAVELAAFVKALESRQELMFFVMRAGLGTGDQCRIHLFEPRYRWLVSRALSDAAERGDDSAPWLGFVTSGRAELGASGIMCKIKDHSRCSDGSYDIVIEGCETFSIEHVTTSPVPDEYAGGRGTPPPLYHGKVQFTSEGGQDAAAVGGDGRASALGRDGSGGGGGNIRAGAIPRELVAVALQAAISRGVPMWNSGDTAGCAALYRAVAERLQDADPRLHQALRRAEGRSTGASRSSQGWILRYAFDDILRDPSGERGGGSNGGRDRSCAIM